MCLAIERNEVEDKDKSSCYNHSCIKEKCCRKKIMLLVSCSIQYLLITDTDISSRNMTTWFHSKIPHFWNRFNFPFLRCMQNNCRRSHNTQNTAEKAINKLYEDTLKAKTELPQHFNWNKINQNPILNNQ